MGERAGADGHRREWARVDVGERGVARAREEGACGKSPGTRRVLCVVCCVLCENKELCAREREGPFEVTSLSEMCNCMQD